MDNTEHSLKRTARLAGFLYVIMGIPAAYGIMYVPSLIMVQGMLLQQPTISLPMNFYFALVLSASLSVTHYLYFWYWFFIDC